MTGPVGLLSVSSALVGALSYGCSLALAHLLAPAEFTVFAAAAALVGTAGVASAALVPLPLATAVRRHGGNGPARRDATTFAVATSLLVGLATAAALAAVTATFGGAGVVTAVAAATVALFVIAPLWGVLQGAARFRRYAGLTVAEVAVRLLATVGAVALGAGAAGALWGFTAGAAVVLLAAATGLTAQVWRSPRQWFRVLADRARWSEVGAVAAVQVVLSAMAAADAVVVTSLVGTDPAAAAGYQAVATVAKAPIYLAVASALVSFPQLRAHSGPGRDLVMRAALRSFVRLLLPAVAVVATLPAGIALLVLPAAYASSLPLLPWLAVAGAGLGTVTVVAMLLLAVREHRLLAGGLVAAAGALAVGLGVGASSGPAGLAVGGATGAVVGAAVLVTALVTTGAAGRGAGPGAESQPAPVQRRPGGDRARAALVRAALIRVALVVGVPALLHESVTAWSVAVVVIGAVVVGGPVLTARARAAVAPGGNAAPGAPHVLHLGFEDPEIPGAGGGSLRTAEINRRIAAAGYRITVLTTRYPGARDRTEHHGDGSVRWVHLGAGPGRTRLGRLAGYVAAAPLFVRAVDTDLVVEDFCAPFSSMGVGWWTATPTVGVVQWLNARDKAREYHVPIHLVERITVRSHRRFVAVSGGVAAKLAGFAPASTVDVIGNGIDPVARTVSAPRGPDTVFVGRLEIAQKGLDLLLDAWVQAAPQLPGSLVLAGTGPDEAALRARVDRLGLSDRVRFAGWVAGREKFVLLAGARVAVVPSRFETFGIVAAEALAVGTPVVAYDIDCLREVVPADCGVLVPPTGTPTGDATDFATALVALHRDRDRLDLAAHRGPIAAAPHDWDALARAQEKVYADETAAACLLPAVSGGHR